MRLPPRPRQLPRNVARRTSRRPSVVIPALARAGVRRRDEAAAAQQDTRRAAGREREEVAVDPGRGRLRGEPSLHRGQRLAPDDRLVREHRLERRQATGSRPAQHVDRNRPTRRELDALLVRDTRPERPRRRVGGRTEHSGEREHCHDDEQAAHRPRPRVVQRPAAPVNPHGFRTKRSAGRRNDGPRGRVTDETVPMQPRSRQPPRRSGVR